MRDSTPKTIYLKDYKSPDFLIESTHLQFELFDDHTLVTSRLSIKRNGLHANPLILHGQELEFIRCGINGKELAANAYQLDDEQLIILNPPETCEFSCQVKIYPHKNTALEGLYQSNGLFCTQCEAEGFRKITYFIDRPDVLSVFTTHIIANPSACPILLSNGNCLEKGINSDGTHFAVWQDPFPKPAYLFALVAGQLSCVQDTFVTMTGRSVSLQIFVEEKDVNKCAHALKSLQNAMRWDEEVYGCEYDLDVYMIVAVDDFNMGAMENKGLNVFNTSCVLANSQTTTDTGFQRVEAVVAHEYFHNWSGNRVTCRDWFQLSLKEGFTVFRDAEFSADMGSRAVKRIEQAQLMRTQQFAEDAGPMAHPVQPASFMEISNFYTLTVYEKGAEVVRMIHTLLGAELFRQGTDLYFSRHDGQAVTIDDFVAAMADVSGRDFSQFMAWYRQAGTPVVKVEDSYNPNTREYQLIFTQTCPSTPEAKSSEKQPFHIPMAVGLLGEAGALRLKIKEEHQEPELADNTHRILEMTKTQEIYTFCDIPERPVPSLLRNFSAPIKLEYAYSESDLIRLAICDQDGFSRWNACQQLGLLAIEGVAQNNFQAAKSLVDVYRHLLNDYHLDPALIALMLQLPSESYLGETQTIVQVDQNHLSRKTLHNFIAEALQEPLQQVYTRCQQALIPLGQSISGQAVALRSLQNCTLAYLMALPEHHSLGLRQYEKGANMTEIMAAFTAIVHSDYPGLAKDKARVLDHFYQMWQHEPLVVNQWLAVQASSSEENVLSKIKALRESPVFDIKNPNKVRSLIGVFANQNHRHFHALDGAGYEFLADEILLLNRQNPQIAARLLTPLSKWRRYDQTRQALMRVQLLRIQAADNLSKDVYEVVNKSLIEDKT
jgi:aminopeptidase N